MKSRKVIGIFEIVLLISFSFAVSVLMSGSLVSGQSGIPTAPFEQGLDAAIARAKVLTPPFKPTTFNNGIPLGPNGELLTPSITPTWTGLPKSVVKQATGKFVGPPYDPSAAGSAGVLPGTGPTGPLAPGTPVIFDPSQGIWIAASQAGVGGGSGGLTFVGAKEVFFGGKLYNGPVFADASGTHIFNTGAETVKYAGKDWVTYGADAPKLPPGTQAASQTGGGGSFLGSGPGTLGGLFGGNFFGAGSAAGGTAAAGIAGALTTGLIWGAAVYGATYFIAKAFGQTKKQAQSIATGLGAGMFTWYSLSYWGINNGAIPYLTSATASFVWGIGIAAAIIILTYKKEKTEIVVFSCLPWEPPTGGQNCEKCNEDSLVPCSEYRCKSLGQACEIVNPGTENELCVWVNKNDVKAPVIETWKEALKPAGLEYKRDGLGYRIYNSKDSKGCLEPFTRLEFGIKTDEPAQCKLDLELKDNYNDMTFLFGETNLYGIEHAQKKFRVPNPFAAQFEGEVPSIYNNGVFTMYARCRDANGNGEDSAPVPFKFCISEGPDAKAPVIEGFNFENRAPVQYEVDSVNVEVYTNEPSTCKWSRVDKDLDAMENEMSCSTQAGPRFNSNLQFICSGRLTSIQDREENNFFFRCKDALNNEMSVGEKLTLRGTEPLVLKNVGPSGEIRGSTSVVELNLTAETSFGADEGKATCYYEFEESGQFNVAMLGAGTASHNQPVFLGNGDYTAYLRCIDAGGNAAENRTSFRVFVDTEAPRISRVYKSGTNLKIITNEEARCVYSLNSCSYEFASGLPLNYESVAGVIKKNLHVGAWDKDKTYYVKCEDMQGKRVAPDKCSIVVRGAEF